MAEPGQGGPPSGGVELARLSPTLWFATGFGAGFGQPGPGTRGSLVGLLLAYGVTAITDSPWAVPVAAVLACGFGVPICAAGVRHFGREDPPEVVWDEVAGMLVVFSWLPLTWFWGLCGFLLFRLFDIWKPWPVSRFEKLPGAWGVLADDVAAALLVQAAVFLGLYLYIQLIFLHAFFR